MGERKRAFYCRINEFENPTKLNLTILVIWLDMVHIKWTNFHVIWIISKSCIQYGDEYLSISIGEIILCNDDEFAASETGWINISKTSKFSDNPEHDDDSEVTGLVPVNYLEPIQNHTNDSDETADGGRRNFT